MTSSLIKPWHQWVSALILSLLIAVLVNSCPACTFEPQTPGDPGTNPSGHCVGNFICTNVQCMCVPWATNGTPDGGLD